MDACLVVLGLACCGDELSLPVALGRVYAHRQQQCQDLQRHHANMLPLLPNGQVEAKVWRSRVSVHTKAECSMIWPIPARRPRNGSQSAAARR